MARAKSTAKRMDDAFKALQKLREVYGLPYYASIKEVPDLDVLRGSYGMATDDASNLRVYVHQLHEAFGYVPPKPKGGINAA